MQTYVISLAYPRQLLEKLNLLLGLNVELIPGIYGNNPKVSKYIEPNFAIYGPESAIGCAVSHVNAWQKFLSTDMQCALILEDDVTMELDFTDRVYDALGSVPNDYDVLYLGCFGCSPDSGSILRAVYCCLGKCKGREQILPTSAIIAPSLALGMHAYIVSRKGAETLLRNLYGHIDNHIDICIQKLASQGHIVTYAVNPRIAFQTSTDSCMTSVDECSSANSTSWHPYIFNVFLDKMHIDTGLSLRYALNVSLFKIYSFNLNAWTLISCIIGIACAYMSVPLSTVSLLYILLTMPDVLFLGTVGNAPLNYVALLTAHLITEMTKIPMVPMG